VLESLRCKASGRQDIDVRSSSASLHLEHSSRGTS
jgi:hypothetical protein